MFTYINDINELKKQYHDLTKKHHPDFGGDIEQMKNINIAYEIQFKKLSSNSFIYNTNKENINMYGNFTGSNYKRSNSAVDLCKNFRAYLHENYPNFKFSVKKQGFNSVYITLLEAPFNIFKDENYYLNQQYTIQWYESYVKEDICIMLDTIRKYANSFNYNNSRAEYDNFDIGFYIHLHITNTFKINNKLANKKIKKVQIKNII